jgi:hypothetical protein
MCPKCIIAGMKWEEYSVIFVRFLECVKLRERFRAVRAKIAEMYSAYFTPLVTYLQICGAFFKKPWSKVKKTDWEATDFRAKSVHSSFKTSGSNNRHLLTIF